MPEDGSRHVLVLVILRRQQRHVHCSPCFHGKKGKKYFSKGKENIHIVAKKAM